MFQLMDNVPILNANQWCGICEQNQLLYTLHYSFILDFK